MSQLTEIFPKVQEAPTRGPVNITEVAARAGISRPTYYRVVKNPENATVKVMRSIAAALGYKMIISFEKMEDL